MKNFDRVFDFIVKTGKIRVGTDVDPEEIVEAWKVVFKGKTCRASLYRRTKFRCIRIKYSSENWYENKEPTSAEYISLIRDVKKKKWMYLIKK